MNTTRRIAARGALALALTALVATPSLADSRPRNETRSHHETSGIRGGRGGEHHGSDTNGASRRSGSSLGLRSPSRNSDRHRSEVTKPSAPSRGIQPRWPGPRTGPDRDRSNDSKPRWQGNNGDRNYLKPAPALPRHSPRVESTDGRWRDRTHDGRSPSRQWTPRAPLRDSNLGGRDDRHRGDGWRDDHRRHEGWRIDRHDNRPMHRYQGRVSRLEHRHGGYNVWLDHGRHPFFIPDARFLLWPLRVGLSVAFGGCWEPSGYYSVYEAGPIGGYYGYGGGYGGGYGYGSGYRSGAGYGYGTGYGYGNSVVRGVVEQFDYQTGTVLLRDESSGRWVTVYLRGDDPQLGDLRPGDYVELSGVWSTGGVFEAYRVAGYYQR